MESEKGFARWLKEFRKRAKLIQPDFAELVGVSLITVKRWEMGIRTPRIEEIEKICKVLNCTESELLNGPDNQNWELKLVVAKTSQNEGGMIDMTGATNTATLSISDNAMAITLSAEYALWEDDAKFEDLIADLRRKRQLGLNTRREGW